MNRIVSAAVVMLAATTASLAITRWLTAREERGKPMRREQLESWENEGGALAPRGLAAGTSQVPR
jgi:hypothetical protein